MKIICVIGLGNMGKAIFDSLTLNKEFSVIGCDRGDEINSKIEKSDLFVIAVKPQDFETLSKEITADLSHKLAISIMAGVGIKRIQDTLKIVKIVRVMPNLPLKVGEALSGWFCSKDVTKDEKEIVKKILCSLGEEIEVSEEEKIDAITALSGSGPAYFFYLTELIAQAAVDFGFSEEEAEKIAKNTFFGSAAVAEKSSDTIKTLREKVTSKGGTTEAALKYLNENKFDKTFKEAIRVAYNRAKKLNSSK